MSCFGNATFFLSLKSLGPFVGFFQLKTMCSNYTMTQSMDAMLNNADMFDFIIKKVKTVAYSLIPYEKS